MPDGIIRDPKQNAEESDFGILFETDLNEYCAYTKGDDFNKRAIPSGWHVTTSNRRLLAIPIPWDNSFIRYVVDITPDPDDPTNKKVLHKQRQSLNQGDFTQGTNPRLKIKTYLGE